MENCIQIILYEKRIWLIKQGKRRHKNQRPIRLHTQESHKNIILGEVTQSQKTTRVMHSLISGY